MNFFPLSHELISAPAHSHFVGAGLILGHFDFFFQDPEIISELLTDNF
jgi:hypothetical protein